ncbi:MAG TPA: hypothetical protein VHS80_13810 [Chthoniobacterales bacterium]|nr:hypothetical protein [Chthoniobacterales bacterium]
MKPIFWGRVEGARKLGSFALVCFVLVTWVVGRACLAIFQDAIFHSLQDWLLSRNFRRQPREARSNYQVVVGREDVATSHSKM